LPVTQSAWSKAQIDDVVTKIKTKIDKLDSELKKTKNESEKLNNHHVSKLKELKETKNKSLKANTDETEIVQLRQKIDTLTEKQQEAEKKQQETEKKQQETDSVVQMLKQRSDEFPSNRHRDSRPAPTGGAKKSTESAAHRSVSATQRGLLPQSGSRQQQTMKNK
jgi:chromosome segregation ATPase